MATITIRNLPDETKRNLRIRAAENGHSMEEEARHMLVRAGKLVRAPAPFGGAWVDELLAKLQAVGDVELELPEREVAGDALDFSGPEFDP